jgi:hypothetical protein
MALRAKAPCLVAKLYPSPGMIVSFHSIVSIREASGADKETPSDRSSQAGVRPALKWRA